MSLEIDFYQATIDDCKMIFDWRNDPDIYKHFFNNQPVEWKTHENWFSKMLISQYIKLLIAFNEKNEIIGQIRFDINEVEVSKAEIGIIVAKMFQGQGYGTKIIFSGCHYVQKNYNINTFVAKIKPENIASIKSFQRAGFQISNSLTDTRVILMNFSL